MTEIPPEVAEAVRSLRMEYALKLPSKIREIAVCAECLATSASPKAELKQIVLMAHRLKGSAGSYGFDKTGLAASFLEDHAIDLLRGKMELTERHIGHLLKCVVELKDAVSSDLKNGF